ncbi:MAG: hypothetical protein QNJ71_07705, partial [Acidimicrobiia bacterium]|nr:hypothetical protein [Acidimicrobiia bacterium]
MTIPEVPPPPAELDDREREQYREGMSPRRRLRRRKPKSGLSKRESRLGVALMIPTVLVIVLLVILPLVWNVA